MGETPSGVSWQSEQKQKKTQDYSFIRRFSLLSQCLEEPINCTFFYFFSFFPLFVILSAGLLQSGGVRPDRRRLTGDRRCCQVETHTLQSHRNGRTHVVFVQGEVVRGQHSDSQAGAQRRVQEAAQDRLILQRPPKK